jgi:hypothetical protein
VIERRPTIPLVGEDLVRVLAVGITSPTLMTLLAENERDIVRLAMEEFERRNVPSHLDVNLAVEAFRKIAAAPPMERIELPFVEGKSAPRNRAERRREKRRGR